MTIHTCAQPLAVRNPGPGAQPSGGLQTIPATNPNPYGASVAPGQFLIIPATNSPITVPDWVGQSLEFLYYAASDWPQPPTIT
jgi:hypothetical protein